MDNKVYLVIRKIIKVTILNLWLVVAFGLLAMIFSNTEIFSLVVYGLLSTSGVMLLILLVVSIYYFVKMNKEYKTSNHFIHTKKSYFDLKNKEKVVYNVSVILEERFNIECKFNHDSIDHLFFTFKNISYSLLIKEYNGDVLGNSLDPMWKIGYKRQKDNTYFNKITVSNPILQNQRIIERNYIKDFKNIKNLILVSDKTDKSPLLREVVYLNELIKKLSR